MRVLRTLRYVVAVTFVSGDRAPEVLSSISIWVEGLCEL